MTHFERYAFRYCEDTDSWHCPNDCTLTRKQINKGVVIYAAQASDCAHCPLKPQCTDAARRFVTRHAQEAAFERLDARLATRPEKMSLRRQAVEHPFGNLKQWIMGNGRFLMWGLQGATTEMEMALAVTAYNLRRTINILEVNQLLAKRA